MEESGCRGELTPAMRELIDAVRRELGSDPAPREASRAVADRVAAFVGRDDLLTAAQRAASSDGYAQHVLHVEEDGSFSVVSLVWLEGQDTPVHDHVSWCVPAVHRGREEEVRYRLVDPGSGGHADPGGGAETGGAAEAGGPVEGRGGPGAGGGPTHPYLVPAGTGVNEPGDVTALTPPGDVHRVRNPGPGKAVSIHVYGADIVRLGSSIRRTYDLEVRASSGRR